MGEATPIVWENLLRENVASISGKGRYTCIDGSPKGRLALGTASGSVYLYELSERRTPSNGSSISAQLLEVVPLPVTARVSQVRISPTDNHVAVAVAGEVFIVTMNFRAKKQKVVVKSSFHGEVWREALKEKEAAAADGSASAAGGGQTAGSGATGPAEVSSNPPNITALEWDASGERVFSGDDQGVICSTPISTGRGLMMTQLFASTILLRMSLPIVQLCYNPFGATQLLASDTAKTVIIDLASSKSTQIGRQLRNGLYGACFHPSKTDVALLARPNMRVWEALISLAKVSKTIKFDQSAAEADGLKTLGRLVALNNLIVSHCKEGIAILDPDKPALLESIVGPTSVEGATVVQCTNDLYVLSEGGLVQRFYQKPTPQVKEEPTPEPPAEPTIPEPTPEPSSQEQTSGLQPEPETKQEPASVPKPEPETVLEVKEEPKQEKDENKLQEEQKPISEDKLTPVQDPAVDPSKEKEAIEEPKLPENKTVEPARDEGTPIEPVKQVAAPSNPEVPEVVSTPEVIVPLVEENHSSNIVVQPPTIQKSVGVRSQTAPMPCNSDEVFEGQGMSSSPVFLSRPQDVSKTLPLGDEIVPIKKRRNPKKRRPAQVVTIENESAPPVARKSGSPTPVPAPTAAPAPAPVIQQEAPIVEPPKEPQPTVTTSSPPQNVSTPSLVQVSSSTSLTSTVSSDSLSTPSPTVEESTPPVVVKPNDPDISPIASPGSPSVVNDANVSGSFESSLPISMPKHMQKDSASASVGAALSDAASSPGQKGERSSASSSISRSLTTMRKMMSGTMKELSKLPTIAKAKHSSEGSTSSEIFMAATQQHDLIETMNAGPASVDEDIPFAELTSNVFKFVQKGSSVDGTIVKQWLAFWLKKAVVNDLTEFSKKKSGDNIENELQVLSNKCFELRISTTEGTGDCLDVIIDNCGRFLSLQSCFTIASDGKDEKTCKKILGLYPLYSRAYSDIAKSVKAHEMSGAAARVRGTDDAGLFISVAPMLVELDEAQTVEIAVRLYPVVNEWQILHLVSSKHFYMEYLISFLRVHGMSEENLDRYLRLVHILLEDQPDYDRSSLMNLSNSMPLRGSLRYPWKHTDILLTFLTRFKDDPDAQILLSNEFRSFGFWPGVLALQKLRGERAEAVSLVLALDDADVFEALMSDNADSALWKASIQHVMNDSGESISKSEITIGRVIEVMLSAVGPQKTVDILSSIPGCAERLPISSLRSIMRVGKLSLVDEKNQVCHFLSTVACYLWQRRSRVSNAQLGTVIAYEADEHPEASAVLRSLPFVTVNEDKKNAIRPSFDMTRPQQRFYDENEIGHWGVSCMISAEPSASASAQHLCAFCSLPLIQTDRSPVLSPGRINQQNIVVLPHCGHAYHESCIASTEGCIICLKNNLSHSVTRKRFA